MSETFIINTNPLAKNKSITSMHDLVRYYREHVDANVLGWFMPLDIAIMYGILNQGQKEITGDICELGVAYGKSAVGLSLSKRLEDNLYLFDIFEAQGSLELASGLVREYGLEKNLHYIPGDLMKLDSEKVKFENKLRMLHVDACHFHSAVVNDLRNFSPHMNKDGVIVVDDFNDPEYPGINTAIAHFCLSEARENWKLFAVGGNKAYLCQEHMIKHYIIFLVEYLNSNVSDMKMTFQEIMGVDVLMTQSRDPWPIDKIRSLMHDEIKREYR